MIIGWCLIEAADIAQTSDNQILREGKYATAHYFAGVTLPLTLAKAAKVRYLMQSESVFNPVFTADA